MWLVNYTQSLVCILGFTFLSMLTSFTHHSLVTHSDADENNDSTSVCVTPSGVQIPDLYFSSWKTVVNCLIFLRLALQ